MHSRSEAEDHLRVIRSLMERATIYRAISAPSALVGGILSVIASAAMYWSFRPVRNVGGFEKVFLPVWLGVLVVTAASNFYFLWKDSRRRGDPFISSGMRMALLALLPPFLCAGYFTIFYGTYSAHTLPPYWMIFYGLGLLATAHFAPRSIVALGATFLATGLFSHFWFAVSLWSYWNHAPTVGNLLMGATFGLFHLVYAACTWPRRGSAEELAAMPG